jgi:hypothetical protein
LGTVFPQKSPKKVDVAVYTVIGRKHMTLGDIQFLKAVGIVPCDLGCPLPPAQPPTPPAEAPIHHFTENDARWLQNLGVICDEPEPEFVPPKTLPEYLARFPHGIRDATEAVAMELELLLTDGGLEDLAHEVEEMFVSFLDGDLEDVVALYEFHRSLRPEGLSFPDYMKFRVRACVPVVLQNRMTDADNLGESRRL